MAKYRLSPPGTGFIVGKSSLFTPSFSVLLNPRVLPGQALAKNIWDFPVLFARQRKQANKSIFALLTTRF